MVKMEMFKLKKTMPQIWDLIPREARFINLSCGDRARIAKGRSNLDLAINFSKVSAQLPSNKAKSRPLTVAHSHVCSFLACFAANICVLMFIHRL